MPAYTATPLSADEILYASEDKVCLLTTNEGYTKRNNASFSAGWHRNGNITVLAPIQDGATGFPASRGHDIYSHIRTKPISVRSEWWYIIDSGEFDMTLDSIVLANHNLFTLDCTGVSVFLSDTADVAAGTLIETLAAPTSNQRIVMLDLREPLQATAQRFTDVRWVGIKMEFLANQQPELGEVVLSRRRQLHDKSLIPFDDKKTSSSYSRFVSDGGVQTTYTRFTGRAEKNLRRKTNNTTEIEAIDGFWSDIDFGMQPFYYVENPDTSPNDSECMVMDPPDFNFPDSGAGVRTFSGQFVEQAPFLSKE